MVRIRFFSRSHNRSTNGEGSEGFDRPGEAVHCELGRDIHGDARERSGLTKYGANVDDASPLLWDHATCRVSRKRDERTNIQVEMLIVGVLCTFHERPK